MKVLVIGSGGREHALVWKLKQSEYIEKVYVAPGNAGIAQEAECIDISPDNQRSLASFVENKAVDLTVVGPEDPLANGLVDCFQKRGLRIFGPTKEGAQLESSKIYAKQFMRDNNIPTGSYCTFDNPEDAFRFISKHEPPLVIKADGLAAGKGSIIAKSKAEGKDAVRELMIERTQGEAGKRILIEEYLQGREVSVLAFTDGKNIVTMIPAQDYKRAYDNGRGPNTGGMGAVAPVDQGLSRYNEFIENHILRPTIDGLHERGIIYKGILYAGLMIADDDDIKVLEFNCRFGDPETQVILPLLDTDLAEIMLHIIYDKLDEIEIKWKKDMKSICTIMASGGYPKRYKKGYKIEGLENLNNSNLHVFHAGTVQRGENILTDGGRILGVTAWHKSLKETRDEIYKTIKKIDFKNSFYRNDIGKEFI